MHYNYKDRIIKFRETRNIRTRKNGELMVELNPAVFRVQYLKQNMIPLIGNRMFARQPVVARLVKIQQRLTRDGLGYQLNIAYAYRAPEIQQQYFDQAYRKVVVEQPNLTEEERVEQAHSMVAHPLVAGHPTGAAVDLTLWNVNTNDAVDMGSGIAEFGDIAYTFYPDLNPEQKENRRLLQVFMTDEGFAPFLAEWWHFSYGDKEWARYYRQPYALFGVVPLATVQHMTS